MAKTNNQVKFWRGATLPSTRDTNTLYFDTTGKLYLGDTLIADVTVLDTATVNSLVAQALNQYYTKTQIDGFIQTLNNSISGVDKKFESYRTSAAQDEIDNGIKAQIKAITDDYLVEADKTALEGKITAHETAVNTKFNDYRTSADQDVIDQAQNKALNDYKAEMVETLKGYQTTILAETYDAFGSAATAETNAKKHADNAIDNLIKTYLDGETDDVINTLEEVAAWINNDTAGVTKIIEDVATNKTNIENINKSAPMTSGITAAKVGEYDAVKSTVDTNKSTWDKAGTAVQPEAISDMMTKTEHTTFVNGNAALNSGITAEKVGQYNTAYGWGDHSTQGYAKTADISEDIAKGVEAYSWGDHAEEGYLKAANISGKEDKANLKALAYKDTVGTADIDNDAVTADKLANSINTDIAAGVAAKVVTDTLKSAAFTEASAYATAAQGNLADTALQPVTNVTENHVAVFNANGTIKSYGKSVSEIINNFVEKKSGETGNLTQLTLDGGFEDSGYSVADIIANLRGNAAESVTLGTLVAAINSIVGKQTTTDNTVSELNQALCWEE